MSITSHDTLRALHAGLAEKYGRAQTEDAINAALKKRNRPSVGHLEVYELQNFYNEVSSALYRKTSR